MAIKIVLFEDEEPIRVELLAALKERLGNSGEAVPFEARHIREAPGDREKMYEERIRKILNGRAYEGATLIVADRDLSKSVDSDFRGLSVSSVASAAKRLLIPICSYARQPEMEDYEWQGRWEEGHIVLRYSEGPDELARRSVLAAKGFSEIADGLPAVMNDKSQSVARTLAALLGKPKFTDKIGLYAVGDQNRLTEILVKEPGPQAVKVMSHFLGYWLWDSLLRYPGLFVNQIAAGSHLNIDGEDFKKRTVQDLFAEALYKGPFADEKKPQWWRGLLDDIVAREKCIDGLELARKKVGADVRPSKCRVDASKRAGYYCIISGEPVSLENSKGGMSWFPRGADLTRIGNDKFDEYAPWLGV